MRDHRHAGPRTRRGSTTISAIYVVLLAIVAPLLLLVSGRAAFLPLTFNLGIALSALVLFEIRRCGHPLTPAGIAALGGILVFVLRPITIHQSGLTSPGALLDTRTFTGATVDAAVTSCAQVTLFYAVFGVAYFVLLARPVRRPDATISCSTDVVRRAGVILWITAIFAVICAGILIGTSGGLVAHFTGVAVRSSFLAGRYYLTLSYIPLAVAVVFYVLARRHAGMREWNGGALSAATLLCVVGFTTGGRGPLLLGVILPLLILKQTGKRRLSGRALGLIGVGLIAGAMVMSLFLREGQYDEGASVRAFQEDPVATLLARLTSGAETRPFDSLILLNESSRTGDVPVLLGSTYAAVPTWFIPGDIAPWKDGGANTWFTRTYVPRFYYPDQIETSISAVGEAYANFRYPGILLLGVAVAIAAARLGLVRPDDGLMTRILGVVLTPLFFSFIRGDAYQNVSTVILVIGITALFLTVAGAWTRKGAPAPEGRATGGAADRSR